MLLNDLPRYFNYPYWLNEPGRLLAFRGVYTPHRNDCDIIEKNLHDALDANKRRPAASWAAVGLVLHDARFLRHCRRHGLLRLSPSQFSNASVPFVAQELLTHANALQLHNDTVRYLTSVTLLHSVANALSRARNRILSAIRRRKSEVMRACLAIADRSFLTYDTIGADAALGKTEIYSPEDRAAACSYILHLADEYCQVPLSYRPVPSAGDTMAGYDELILDAAHINVYREWEILVDILDYCIVPGAAPNSFTIVPSSASMEKALRVGFIMTATQKQLSLVNNDALSLRTLADECAKQCGDMIAKRETRPVARLTFHIPEEFLRKVGEDDRLFAEEFAAFRHMSTDLFVDIDELRALEVHRGVTLWELAKVQRIVRFVAFVAGGYIKPLFDTESAVALRSLVPTFTNESLLALCSHAVGEAKAEAVCDLLTWRSSSTKMYDIQYQPFVVFGDLVAVPLNVMAHSDILRNTLYLTGGRLRYGGHGSRIEQELMASLKEQGVPCARNVKFRCAGTNGEIDVVAVWDDLLFIFECKHPLLPCSIHESRTSYDHMCKAARQLDTIGQVYQAQEFRRAIEGRVGRPVSSTSRLVCCIVMGNRMFAGYRIMGHPVRPIFEVCNVVREGILKLGENTIRMWQGDAASAEDLRRYIEEDTIHGPLFRSMDRVYWRYNIGDFSVGYETYALNMEKLYAEWGLDTRGLTE